MNRSSPLFHISEVSFISYLVLNYVSIKKARIEYFLGKSTLGLILHDATDSLKLFKSNYI